MFYPGRLGNRLGTWGARFLPRNLILRLSFKMTGSSTRTSTFELHRSGALDPDNL